jgi:hypothetical protein
VTGRLALVLAVGLVVAGCGGSAKRAAPRQPHLPRAVATELRSRADSVAAALAAGDGCTAQARARALQAAFRTAVNGRRVPPRFQESLSSAVNDLAARITCVPPPAPAPAPVDAKPHGHGHAPGPRHGHGHGHGHGKHG